jgi:hypothetical protein
MEDAHGRGGPDAARAPGIACRPQAGLEIGQGGHSGNGRGEVQAGVSRPRLGQIRSRIRIRDERRGQAMGDEHVPGRPGGREGGTAAEDGGVGRGPRGPSLLKGLGEGIEGADLLEVEGALAGSAGGIEGCGGAGAAAPERRQEGGDGRGEPGGEQQEGQGAGVRTGGRMVTQAAREGIGEILRPAPETLDRPWIAGEGAEREGVRRPQQQMPGRGGVWQQAAREGSHRRGKMVPWDRDASGCLDLRPWSSMSWEAP